MKTIFILLCPLSLMLLTPRSTAVKDKPKITVEEIKVMLQKRVDSDLDKKAFTTVHEIQQWNPSETAIIICDMWNQHWCKGATERVTELAPQINRVITLGRKKGMLIVHAPSECMDFYKDYPGRKLAQKYRNTNVQGLISDDKLHTEANAVWPIDQSDGGCNDSPECKQGRAWEKEIALIEIKDGDVISDSGVELAGLFQAKGIKNVILMGVHTNMCVIGRSFGLRNMARLGMNVVLMRDMTDAMYDSKQWPYVNHFRGVGLVIEYIERYVCPTMLSSDITGRNQFRFKDDEHPVVTSNAIEARHRSIAGRNNSNGDLLKNN